MPEYKSYDMAAHQLYTEQILREVLLGLHSMCKGADAQFFNGHTNIISDRFLVFGITIPNKLSFFLNVLTKILRKTTPSAL